MTRTIANQYLLLCAFAVGVAVAILARRRARIALLQPAYWRWLLTPWKLATAALSTAVLAGAAPYMRSPNWTPGIALAMSLATFATAPWAVGEIWRRRDKSAMFAAACAWLLSSSWLYDAWWYGKRGFYPDDWWESLIASSVLYFAAGVLWNLEAPPMKLAFTDAQWPPLRPAAPFRRVAVPVAAIMAIVGIAVFVPFLLQ
jgi:hypothetical protein